MLCAKPVIQRVFQLGSHAFNYLDTCLKCNGVDYWRKCHVTKYFSRFANIFWIMERFLDCKLFSIFMKTICGPMN